MRETQDYIKITKLLNDENRTRDKRRRPTNSYMVKTMMRKYTYYLAEAMEIKQQERTTSPRQYKKNMSLGYENATQEIARNTNNNQTKGKNNPQKIQTHTSFQRRGEKQNQTKNPQLPDNGAGGGGE